MGGANNFVFLNLLSIGNSMISNSNRTEWSPIQSVIIRVINKIGRPRSGSPICLITHNFNKIGNIIGYFLNQNTSRSRLHKKFEILLC